MQIMFQGDWSTGNSTRRPNKNNSYYFFFKKKKKEKKNVHKKESTGGAYEKPKKASAASLTLAVMRMLSGDWPIELGTGSSVNSGSKCRRSLGPLTFGLKGGVIFLLMRSSQLIGEKKM